MGRQTPEGLRVKIKQTTHGQKAVPSVIPRRILSYCRYADDYVVVLCQHTKAEAEHLKDGNGKMARGETGANPAPGEDATDALGQTIPISGL